MYSKLNWVQGLKTRGCWRGGRQETCLGRVVLFLETGQRILSVNRGMYGNSGLLNRAFTLDRRGWMQT